MHTKLDSPFITGNFKLEVEGELKDEFVSKFIQSGLVYVTQRDVATKAYKTLMPVEKGEKAPKRSTLEYSDDHAAEFKAAFEAAFKPYGEFTCSVSQHVPGETVSPMVRATQFVDELLASDEGKTVLATIAKMSGITATNRDEYIAAAHKGGWGKSK